MFNDIFESAAQHIRHPDRVDEPPEMQSSGSSTAEKSGAMLPPIEGLPAPPSKELEVQHYRDLACVQYRSYLDLQKRMKAIGEKLQKESANCSICKELLSPNGECNNCLQDENHITAVGSTRLRQAPMQYFGGQGVKNVWAPPTHTGMAQYQWFQQPPAGEQPSLGQSMVAYSSPQTVSSGVGVPTQLKAPLESASSGANG